MLQEQRNTITIGNLHVTVGQLLLGVILLLLAVFVVYGSFSQPGSTGNALVVLPTTSFPLLALLAFAGGMLSFLSPCTLPILPAYFAFAFRSGRATIAANTLAFMLGLATMFSLFGASASTLGSLLYTQQRLILLIGGALIIVFGLMSILGLGFGGAQSATSTVERNTTLGGSFVFGLTFAVGWSSCVGPILGIVLTLAATTASVLQGIMLLFIYAMGLGLPLMVVSALFGRAPRDSFIWRVLRGRGSERTIRTRTLAMIWAVGLWLIALPLLRIALPTFNLDALPVFGMRFEIFSVTLGFNLGVYELALLALAVVLALIWDQLRPGGPATTTLHLHSTSLISGVLFLLMGLLLINSQLAVFNSLLETDLALRLLALEEVFLNWFAR